MLKGGQKCKILFSSCTFQNFEHVQIISADSSLKGLHHWLSQFLLSLFRLVFYFYYELTFSCFEIYCCLTFSCSLIVFNSNDPPLRYFDLISHIFILNSV